MASAMRILLPLLVAAGLLLILSLYYGRMQSLYTSVLRNSYAFGRLPEQQWRPDTFWHDANTFPACSMDACFNFSRCASMDTFRIYAYDPPYNPISYFMALEGSPWLTQDPDHACVFLVMEPEEFSLKLPFRPHPSVLPFWNGGLNHVIATLADKWSLSGPPPYTIGKASLLASSLQNTAYRPGFDISIPLPGFHHFAHLQCLQPSNRKYLLSFKGTRYLGPIEGNFRSDHAFRALHNGADIIVAVTCNHVTNNKLRRQHAELSRGCAEDEAIYQNYDFGDLMNATFSLVPAGRSPATYRMIETLSAGAIPVLVADNYVKPFESMIQWHRCLLEFPTSEVGRIPQSLRAMTRREMDRRQRYCLFIYEEYLKDNSTLVRSIVRALKLRFYGMLPQFREAIPDMAVPQKGNNITAV